MPVVTERLGHTLVVRNDRPEKRNAIDPETTAGFDAALTELDDDAELWVGILTGTETVFSAGSDLAKTAGPPTPAGGEYGVIRRRRRKPLIAAVEGIAYGGGLELVLACDLVVAGRSARFGLPEASRGVVATCGGLFRTARSLPPNIASQLLLTGQPLSAERAWSLGLVNELVDDGSALTAAIGLAELVAANSPTSITATLGAMQECVQAIDAIGWQATARAIEHLGTSGNTAEGIAAFLEKREPRWTSP